MKTTTILLASSLLLSVCAEAASMAIAVSIADVQTIQDASGTPLTSGDPDARGDGALIQVGYFSDDTATFSGTWIPIAGLSSTNSSLNITVGDFDDPGAIPDGYVGKTVVFDSTKGTNVGLPSVDTQLAVRIYDTTSEASLGTANYNTVTHSVWKRKGLATPPPTTTILQLDSGGTVWEDSSAPFQTSIAPVPEPSSFALLGLGAAAMLFRRRK